MGEALEALEAALQGELETSLKELGDLDLRLCRLGNETLCHDPSQVVLLEDLPLERICPFLPANGFATLRLCGGQVGRRVQEFLDQLAQYHKTSDCPGPPMLLSLLHFSHCVQAPHLSFTGSQDVPAGSIGCALEQLPPFLVGSDEAEKWCPVRLRSKLRRSQAYGGERVGHTCTWRIRRHVTPRILQLTFCVDVGVLQEECGQQVCLSLVDAAVPRQPLFSVTQEHTKHGPTLVASLREVVSCRGAPGTWAFKQRSWPLEAEGHELSTCAWTQLHFEFDWDAALSVAMVNGHVEEPLDLHAPCSGGRVDNTEFGGADPTVDQLHIKVAPGMSLAIAELLVG